MAWTSKKGFNFRSTVAFVTDGTNEIPITHTAGNIGPAYPSSKTVDGDTFNIGWSSAGSDGARDRTNTSPPRLAGVHFKSNNGTQNTFRVNLPSAGVYAITLAIGDSNAIVTPYWQIVDDSSVLESVDKTVSPTTPDQYYDATGVLRTSAATWVSGNVEKEYTFASTVFNIRIGTTGAGAGNTHIAHLGIRQVSAGGDTLMGQICI